MSQKYEHLNSQRKLPLGRGRTVFMLSCLTLPVVFYLVSGHPAFIVIFISGLGGISFYLARVNDKKEGL